MCCFGQQCHYQVEDTGTHFGTAYHFATKAIIAFTKRQSSGAYRSKSSLTGDHSSAVVRARDSVPVQLLSLKSSAELPPQLGSGGLACL